MKKIAIALLCIYGTGVGITLSTPAHAETYTQKNITTSLNKKTITIEEVKQIEYLNENDIANNVKLGDFYLFNTVYKNTFKSYKYIETAAIQGSEYARMMQGYMVLKGIGTDPNVYRGRFLLSNVKKPYDKNARFFLAKDYYDNKEYDKAIETFKTINDHLSYQYLAEMYHVKKQYDEAIYYFEWLIKEKNDNKSKIEVSRIYFNNDTPNEERAVKLLTEAAEDGEAEAQYLLGMYFKLGTKDTIANMKEATRWFAISAQNDHAAAITELLQIWSENEAYDDKYGLGDNKYLTKIVNDIYTEMHLNK